MTCLFCNAEIADDVLICPECGGRVAVHMQKKKVEQLEEKAIRLMNEAFNGWLFLAVSICISVITALMLSVSVSHLFTVINEGDGYFDFILWSACTIPCIISTVNTWKCFSARKTGINPESVASLKSYPAFVKTILKVMFVLFCIVCGLILILIFMALLVKRQLSDMMGGISSGASEIGADFVGEAVGAFDGWLSTGLALVIILTLVSMAAIIAMMVFLIKLFGRTAKHYVHLRDALTINQYNDFRRAPFIQLVLSGGLFIAMGFTSAIALNWSALVLCANGAYLIFNGFFFRRLEEKEIDNLVILRAEHDRLEIYQEETKKLEDEEHRRKKREEEELLRAAVLKKVSN